MVEAMFLPAKTLPPHIRSKDSLGRRFWGQTFALLPLFLVACWTGHAQILRVLLLCLVSGVAFEYLGAKVFRKKEDLKSGEVVLGAALFSLLLPSRCPSEIVILGVFFMSVAGKTLLGGTGSYALHPVLLARLFLQVSFPQRMDDPMLFSGGGDLWLLAAVGLGGIFLSKQKQGYWETPFLFITVCFLLEALGGFRGLSVPFWSGVLFTAFFLLADPVGMPLTRKGTVLFVIGAAFLSAFSLGGSFTIARAGAAILGMNLLTPWLDAGLKPVPYSPQKHKRKAATA